MPKSHSFKIRFKNSKKLVKTTTTKKQKRKRKRKRKVPSLFMKNAAAAAAIYAGTDDCRTTDATKIPTG